MNGRSIAEHVGRPIADVLPELWPTVEPLFRQVLDTGVAVHGIEVSGPDAGAPGLERSWIVSYHPVLDAAGAIEGVGVIVEEVTERKLAERTSRLLSAAADLAWTDPDVGTALEAIAQPADSRAGRSRRARHLQRRGGRPARGAAGARRRRRRAALDARADGPSLLHRSVDSAPTAVWTSTVRATSRCGPAWPCMPAIAVPMRAGGRVVGALGVASSPAGGCATGTATTAVLQELSGRLGQVLEHAALADLAAAAEGRWRLMASAVALVETELDVARRADRIAQLSVPEFADCSIVFVMEDGRLHLIATAHADPDTAEVLAGIAWPDLDLDSQAGAAEAARTGRALLTRTPDRPARRATTPTARRWTWWSLLGLCSALVVPLQADGETIGVLAFTHGPSGRHYRGPTWSWPRSSAAWRRPPSPTPGASSRNGRRPRSCSAASCPSTCPRWRAWRWPPGTSPVRPSSRSAATGTTCWAIPTHGLLVIGDVVGHSIDAAVAMGRLRTVVQFSAQDHAEPAALCIRWTASCARPTPTAWPPCWWSATTPSTGRIAAASAGHLPPLIVAPDGSTAFLALEPGPPLCVGIDSRYEAFSGTRGGRQPPGAVHRRADRAAAGIDRRRSRPPGRRGPRRGRHGGRGGRRAAGPPRARRRARGRRRPPRGPHRRGRRRSRPVDRARYRLAAGRAPAIRVWLDHVGAEGADDVLVAAHEAVANAVEHPYLGAVARPIRITGGSTADQLWDPHHRPGSVATGGRQRRAAADGAC